MATFISMETQIEELDVNYLNESIVSFVSTRLAEDSTKIIDAIELASILHRNDVRDSEKGGPQPYIIHPLRNTYRLIQLGAMNQSLLIAAVLHDTVEDHPFDLASIAGYKTDDEAVARDVSLAHISNRFNPDVAAIVKGMSNPLAQDKGSSREEKNAIYARHVQEAIQDKMVFACKVSDFIDNAIGLVRNKGNGSPAVLQRRATKYLPVVDVLEHRLRKGIEQGDLPLSHEGIAQIEDLLHYGRDGLTQIVHNDQKGITEPHFAAETC